jgi:hypothetical protein
MEQCHRKKHKPSAEKLNKGGSCFPVDIFVSGLRNSSKKGCAIVSIAVGLASGLYCKIDDNRSIASIGVFNLNIYSRWLVIVAVNTYNTYFC